jgi:hypothetical protein
MTTTQNLVTGVLLAGAAFYWVNPQAFLSTADRVVAQITPACREGCAKAPAAQKKWRIEVGPAPLCENQDDLGSSATRVRDRYLSALDRCHNVGEGTEATIVKFDEKCHSDSHLINLTTADGWKGWTFMTTIKPKTMGYDDFIQALVDEGLPCQK